MIAAFSADFISSNKVSNSIKITFSNKDLKKQNNNKSYNCVVYYLYSSFFLVLAFPYNKATIYFMKS